MNFDREAIKKSDNLWRCDMKTTAIHNSAMSVGIIYNTD
jgi:hypothetical protein